MDRHFIRLTQITTHKHLATKIVDDILKDGYIDYQIPYDFIQDTKHEHLNGCTALHIVTQDSNIQAAQKLLQHGADFTIKNTAGETPLHEAVIKNYFSKTTKDNSLDSLIKAFLDAQIKWDFGKDFCNKNGLTHFHAACIVNHKCAVQFFISNFTSINSTINLDSPYAPGYTPLHFAARYSNSKVFEILLNYGANLTLRNAEGLTPLHLLIEHNITNNPVSISFQENKKMIDLVLDIYRNRVNEFFADTGLFYWHVLCILKNKDNLERFMSKNDVNLQDSVAEDSPLWPGYTGLHFASLFSINIAKLLVKRGANIMAKDVKGTTPLDLCLLQYRVEDKISIVECHPDWKNIMLTDEKTSFLELLDAMKSEKLFENFIRKVDINTTFIPISSPLWPGSTLLHLAIAIFIYKYKNFTLENEKISKLLRLGASVKAKDSHGSTPIHTALRLGKYDIIKLLATDQLLSDDIDDYNLSHLQAACAAQNLNAVQMIIQSGNFNINLPLPFDLKFRRCVTTNLMNYFFTAGSTPLHMAVITRNVNITRVLVENGADVLAKDTKGMTPIHKLLDEYSWARLEEIGEILMSVDNLKDVVTSFGLSHLHIACWLNHKTAIEKLLDQGVDINIMLSDVLKLTEMQQEEQLLCLSIYKNYRPINFACCTKQSNILEILFQRCEYILGDPKDILKAAFSTSAYDLFRNFKKKHATTLEMWEKDLGMTALHVACDLIDVDEIKKLLESGADPTTLVSSKLTKWFGFSPLHILVDNSNFSNKRKDIPLLLLYSQKDFHINPGSDSRRISHFHIACMYNAVVIVEKFLEHGVDVDLTVNYLNASFGGYTPLHVAAYFNAKETVDLLLKHKADVCARNRENDTPLHSATRRSGNNRTLDRTSCEPVIRSLISAGAEVNVTNIHGETPLEVYLKTQTPTEELLEILSENQRRVNNFNTGDGTGYIATAIKRLTKIKSIFEHPFYEAVITSPALNGIEKDGRTPVHNIVSIKKVAAPIRIYTKAIEGFLKLGFDIDHCDKTGQTALHVAVKFRNSKAVAALLILGAKINMICNDETPFSYHWKRHESYNLTKLLEKDRQIINLFANQVYKLLLISFDVIRMDESIEANLRERILPLDLKLVEKCQIELERMETRKIGQSNVIWSSFLSETGAVAAFPNMMQIDRQIICDIFEKRSIRVREEFPEFAGILFMQYGKARARMPLVEPSKDSLALLLDFSFPRLCSERILRFLKNEDLVNLIDATEKPMFHAAKRRKLEDK